MEQNSVSQADFVWNVLTPLTSNRKADCTTNMVSKMYDLGLEFSQNVENLLLEYWQTPNLENLTELAKESSREGLLEINKHFYVVAKLYSHSEVTVDEAACMLNVCEMSKSDTVKKNVEGVVDALWLVNEDLKDGFKKPSDDDFLGKALLTLSESADLESTEKS